MGIWNYHYFKASKLRKYFIFYVLFLVWPVSLLSKEPDWYGKLYQKDYKIIGYGKDIELEKAKSKARQNIAHDIQTRISSESVIEIRENNGEVAEKSSISVTAKTDISLENLTVEKQEKVGDIWYVAIVYENLPFEMKFVKEVAKYNLKEEQQNKYLSKTPLVSKINELLNVLIVSQIICEFYIFLV